MQYIEFDHYEAGKPVIDLVVDALLSGKTIGYLSDTIYGLGCRADDEQAVRRIYEIKGRPEDKPLLVLVSSLNMLENYAYISHAQRQFLKKVWPGPLTAVLKRKGGLAGNLTAGKDSLAVRLPKNDILCRIIRRIGVPLVSTSFNLSSKNTYRDPKDLLGSLSGRKPDLFLDSGPIKKARSSRIVDIRDINDIKIIRN